MELFNNLGEEDIKIDNLEQIKNSIFSIIDEKKYIYSDLLKSFFMNLIIEKPLALSLEIKKYSLLIKKHCIL